MRSILLILVAVLGATTAAAQPEIDADPPPGYPADFPYLPTRHGLAGLNVVWGSHELCDVISLAYAEPATRLRVRMRRAITRAGWRVVRDHRTSIDDTKQGFVIEGRRHGASVLAVMIPRGRATMLQIYDC